MPIYANERMCNFCSAWRNLGFEESKNFGHCTRYDMKTQAYEWCETWDKKILLKRRY